jgi:hypothetical protein
VSNVLNQEKKKRVIAPGQLGWALRRIEEATGVRRETAPGGLGRGKAESANQVTTGPEPAKPANAGEVTTGSDAPETSNGPAASTNALWRELIEVALSHGRKAMSVWQELAHHHGFTIRRLCVRCI